MALGGAKNIRQLISVHRGRHSEKPEIVIESITKMFPAQRKIELFARKSYANWDNWGLEIPSQKATILSQGELDSASQAAIKNPQLRLQI